MARPNVQLRFAHSFVLRYGLTVASVTIALAISFILEGHNFHRGALPLFLFAVALSAWYGGVGPAMLAIALSVLTFDYYFAPPLHSLKFTLADVPSFLFLLTFGALIAGFSAVRRRVEADLVQARDKLEIEIAARTQQASLLDSLNHELAQRSTELESINKELEAFAYSISHDLRAPLRHMAGYTELLQKRASSGLDEKGNHYIAMMLESAKRMGNLIDDLLAFSRIGRAETQKTLVSLEQLAKEALSEVREDADGRSIAWKIGTLPDFYGDRSMLRLVLVNLISNAVKFTRTRPQAEIEIGSANGNSDELIIFVRDNGVGFDMKYVNKLFGVFNGCTKRVNLKGPALDWLRCSGSYIVTEGKSGPRLRLIAARLSIFRLLDHKDTYGAREQTRPYFDG